MNEYVVYITWFLQDSIKCRIKRPEYIILKHNLVEFCTVRLRYIIVAFFKEQINNKNAFALNTNDDDDAKPT